MPAPRTSGELFLPAPVNGMDFRYPLNLLPSTYSPFMLNFFSEGGFLAKRPGHSLAVVAPTVVDDFPVCVPAGVGNATHAAFIMDEDYLTNGSTSVASPTPLSTADFFPDMDWIAVGSAIFVAGKTQVWNVNPTALTYSSAFTYSGLSSNSIRKPITYYRERFYFGQSTTLNYSNAGATSGTVNTFAVPLRTGAIRGLGTLSTTIGTSTEQYLVIVSWTGSVLIYSGSYPGASDWGLVNEFDVFLPNGPQGNAVELINVPNDLLIVAKWGYQVYSVRELLSNGITSASFSLVEPLRPLLQRYRVKDSGSGYTAMVKTACYWPKRNALAMAVKVDAKNTTILDDWGDYTGFDNGDGAILFLIDLAGGGITMHSIPNFVPVGTRPATGWTRGQIRAQGDYLMLPQVDGAYKLFDERPDDSDDSELYIDFPGTAIESAFDAICLFAPPNEAGYRLKRVSNALLFSNLYDDHSFSFTINKNFDAGPGSFVTYASSATTPELNIKTLPGGQEGATFIPAIKESSSATTGLEISGLTLIVEQGGHF